MVGQQVAFHRVLRGSAEPDKQTANPHFKNHVLEDKMECIQCGKEFQWLSDDPPEEPMCAKCIDANYKHDVARHRSSHIYYTKELIVVGKAEFECSGYYEDGRLWDEVVEVRGIDVYGMLSDYVEAQIFAEISRRVVSGEIVRRCEEIEKELPDSDDPATLRLERSELDGELEKMEATG